TDTATPEIYTLSLHDALPILLTEGDLPAMCIWKFWESGRSLTAGRSGSWSGIGRDMEGSWSMTGCSTKWGMNRCMFSAIYGSARSEEHTSELQSRFDIVCRLL